jgi:glycosidase
MMMNTKTVVTSLTLATIQNHTNTTQKTGARLFLLIHCKYLTHGWGSDWYKLQPYEQANGEPELWKHLLRRRYGGDLQGIIDQLDYLKALGITALYLNPIFQSPSLHKYDGESYHHVEPTFGPDPEGDRALIATEDPLKPETWVWTKADELALTLIEEVHKRGMRIIFDGVFNHLGYNSFAFKNVREKQAASPYKDWFTIKQWDDPTTPENEFDYEGWWGVKSLPELREVDGNIVAGPKEYIFNATSRWMNPKGKGPAYGIDGWRLDVAFCVGHNFWKDWRQHVRSLNPEAYMTAEIVDIPEKVVPYMQGDEFDGEMNYNFAFTCTEFFFNPDSMRISASEFDKKLQTLRNLYPEGVASVSQNLFGSHDVNRIGSHIVNRGIGNFRDWGTYFALSQAANNPNYDVRKPNAYEIQLQKLFVIMQMTYVGAPMVYYGDEVGMWGANDPDDRKPMVWADLRYADETHLPNGKTRAPDQVAVNEDLLAHYKTMIGIRNNYNAVLAHGTYKTLLADDDKDIFVFERRLKGKTVLVVLNNHEAAQEIILSQLSYTCYTDVLNNKTHPSGETLRLTLPGKWGGVLVPCEEVVE